MRFVQSLDDSVLAHIAGGLTAVVAAATALFSGHTLLNTSSAPSYHRPPYADESGASYDTQDTAVSDSVRSTGDSAYTDTTVVPTTGHLSVPVGVTVVEHPTSSPTHSPLCDRVLRKEDDVDALNTQLDGILRSVKASRRQRRR